MRKSDWCHVISCNSILKNIFVRNIYMSCDIILFVLHLFLGLLFVSSSSSSFSFCMCTISVFIFSTFVPINIKKLLVLTTMSCLCYKTHHSLPPKKKKNVSSHKRGWYANTYILTLQFDCEQNSGNTRQIPRCCISLSLHPAMVEKNVV